MNYWVDEGHLAATGARWAVVNKNPGAGGTLQQTVQQQADTAELRNASVCISFPVDADDGTSGAVGDPVQVTVGYDYNWLPFIVNRVGLDPTIRIEGHATMRLEALPTNYGAGDGGTGSCA